MSLETCLLLLGSLVCVFLVFREMSLFFKINEEGIRELGKDAHLKRRLVASRVRLNTCRAKKCEDKGITLKPYSEEEEEKLDLEEEETEEDSAFAVPIDMLEE